MAGMFRGRPVTVYSKHRGKLICQKKTTVRNGAATKDERGNFIIEWKTKESEWFRLSGGGWGRFEGKLLEHKRCRLLAKHFDPNGNASQFWSFTRKCLRNCGACCAQCPEDKAGWQRRRSSTSNMLAFFNSSFKLSLLFVKKSAN